MMLMELKTMFPPSEVMGALSIRYSQILLELGHEDKLTRFTNTLKQTYNGHTKDISTAPHVYDTNVGVLSGMALDQHFHWFDVAMVDDRLAMRVVNLHVHPLTILWCALARSGPLKGMFLEFYTLAKIAVIQVSDLKIKI